MIRRLFDLVKRAAVEKKQYLKKITFKGLIMVANFCDVLNLPNLKRDRYIYQLELSIFSLGNMT